MATSARGRAPKKGLNTLWEPCVIASEPNRPVVWRHRAALEGLNLQARGNPRAYGTYAPSAASPRLPTDPGKTFAEETKRTAQGDLNHLAWGSPKGRRRALRSYAPCAASPGTPCDPKRARAATVPDVGLQRRNCGPSTALVGPSRVARSSRVVGRPGRCKKLKG